MKKLLIGCAVATAALSASIGTASAVNGSCGPFTGRGINYGVLIARNGNAGPGGASGFCNPNR